MDSQNLYFMKMAYLCGLRSKDAKTQVGACIVNKLKGNIIAVGYNGFPYGCSDEMFPWTKSKSKDDQVEKNKLLYVCHAEANAISNAGMANLKDCVMYVTLHPCHECAKKILMCGIEKVYYLSNKNKNQEGVKAAKEMLGGKLIKFRFDGDGKFEIYKPAHSEFVDPSRIPFFENKEKRNNYLALNGFYMAIALLSSEQCSSTTTKATGACIVRPPFHVVAIGHKEEIVATPRTYEPSLYVCHSPVTAIANRNCGSIKDCVIYTTHFPCNECVKVIIQSKIKKIYYMTEVEGTEMNDAEKSAYMAGYKMLKSAQVTFELCKIHEDIIIDFKVV